MRAPDPDRRALLAVLALGAALIAFGLGAAPLLEPDEGRYADVARAFADRGDWIVPRLDGVTFHDKPPLVPWLAALALRAFGRSELVLRLVPALAGWLGLVAAALLASPPATPLAGAKAESSRSPPRSRAPWLAALVLLASPLWLAFSKLLTLDTTFAALLALAWALALRGPRARVLGGALLGLAVLAKGPVALVLFVVAAAALAGSEREPRLLARVVLVPSGLAVSVAASWYVPFGLRSPDGLRAFLVEENVRRFLDWHEHQHGPHFYFVTALWAHAPLALLLALAGAGRPRAPLVAFVSVVLLVFTAASSKVETYLLPASPVLAALLAERIDAGLSASASRAWLARAALAGSAVSLLAPLGWLGFAWLGARSPDPHKVALAAAAPRCAGLALLAVPLVVASLLGARRGRRVASVACALAASAVTLVAALPLLPVIASGWKSAEPVAALMALDRRPGARVICFMTYLRGLPYYLGEPVALALSSAELSRPTLERERPDLWLPDDERVVAELRSEPRSLLVVVAPGPREERFLALAARAGATRENGRLHALGVAGEEAVYEVRR